MIGNAAKIDDGTGPFKVAAMHAQIQEGHFCVHATYKFQKTTNKIKRGNAEQDRLVSVACIIVQMAPDFGSTMAKLY